MEPLTEAQRDALRREIDRRTRIVLPRRIKVEQTLDRQANGQAPPDKKKRLGKTFCKVCDLRYRDCEQTNCQLGRRRVYMRDYLRGVRRRG